MTINISLTREINGASVVYQLVADTIQRADEMARFLSGATDIGQELPAIDATKVQKAEAAAVIKQAKEEAKKAEPKAEKEPEAKKPQLSGTASTPTLQPEASDSSKAYSYEQVKDLVVKVLQEKDRATASACLARVGLKVLPKDCKDADMLKRLGDLAEGVLAGSVDVMAGEEVEA